MLPPQHAKFTYRFYIRIPHIKLIQYYIPSYQTNSILHTKKSVRNKVLHTDKILYVKSVRKSLFTYGFKSVPNFQYVITKFLVVRYVRTGL